MTGLTQSPDLRLAALLALLMSTRMRSEARGTAAYGLLPSARDGLIPAQHGDLRLALTALIEAGDGMAWMLAQEQAMQAATPVLRAMITDCLAQVAAADKKVA